MDANLQKVFCEDVACMERQIHKTVGLYVPSWVLQSGNNDIPGPQNVGSFWGTCNYLRAKTSHEMDQTKGKIIVNINETKYPLKVLFS